MELRYGDKFLDGLNRLTNVSQQEPNYPNTQTMANGQPYRGPLEQGIKDTTVNDLSTVYSIASLPSAVKSLVKGLGSLTPSIGRLISNEAGSIPKIADAQFIGMEGLPGESKFPLFNVMKPGHELEGSTVGLDTLMKNGLQVPEYQTASPIMPEFSKMLGRPVNADSILNQNELDQIMDSANSSRRIMNLSQRNAETEDVLRTTAKHLGRSWDPSSLSIGDKLK